MAGFRPNDDQMNPFTPNFSNSGVVSVTSVASGMSLSAINFACSIYNTGPSVAFIKFGTNPTAALTDMCVPPATRVVLGTGGAQSISAVTSTGILATLMVTSGNGIL